MSDNGTKKQTASVPTAEDRDLVSLFETMHAEEGTSITDFCQAMGIGRDKFYRMRVKAREGSCQTRGIVPVTVRATGPEAVPGRAKLEGVTLETAGGVRVTLGSIGIAELSELVREIGRTVPC